MDALVKFVKEMKADDAIGKSFVSTDSIRMVPDILQNGEDSYFPVFTTAEEMGEYGDEFSKIQRC